MCNGSHAKGIASALCIRRTHLAIAVITLLGVAPLQFTAVYAETGQAQQQIEQLKKTVQDLLELGDLEKKDGKKLIKKLDKAKNEFEKDNTKKGTKELQKFVNEVSKLIKKGKLSQGQVLINEVIVIFEALGSKPIEMNETNEGLSGTKNIGDIKADQSVRFALIKNELPVAQLDIIEFTPASSATNVSFDITVSNQLLNVPLLEDVDVKLYFEIKPSIDLSISDEFDQTPTVIFEVDKDGLSSADLVLLFFDESVNQWVLLDPPMVLDETDESFIMQGELLHFSQFAIGVTGGGGLGAGGAVGGGGAALPSGKSCGSVLFTNDKTVHGKCVIVDTTPPEMVRLLVTPGDYVCVETHDDTQTVKLTYNGKEVPKWEGSDGYFCTNEALPPIIKLVAEDAAGNKREKITINTEQIVTIRTEQSFTAIVSKDLNPHHGVEGVVLEANIPVKQIRLTKSPSFTDRELYISEKGIMELVGKQTVEVVYKGQYSNMLYGKERYGEIYVFATNMGKIATFDVVVNDDIRLYPHQDKQRHGTFSLDLRSVSVLDEMNLNAWQKAELERIFAGNEELTTVQQNVVGMVLRLAVSV